MDIRFLKLKLKEFERKKLVECKDISGEKCYKCINDLQGLEKKEVLQKKKPTPKKKSVPKKKPASKEQLVPIKKTSENTNKISSERQILMVAKLEESVKAHIEYLNKHPFDESKKESLKKTQKEIERITLELIKHSYYLCPYCIRVFRNNYEFPKN